MGNVKATFLFDAELFAAFKSYAKSEGRTMTWYLVGCMRETLGKAGKLPFGVVEREAGKPVRSKRARAKGQRKAT